LEFNLQKTKCSFLFLLSTGCALKKWMDGRDMGRLPLILNIENFFVPILLSKSHIKNDEMRLRMNLRKRQQQQIFQWFL